MRRSPFLQWLPIEVKPTADVHWGNVMRKFKSRSFVYDALFVIVVMVAAMASAVLEAGAVLGGLPGIDELPTARSAPASADRPAAAGSSVDDALVSVVAPSSVR
jgi:hypothetical protein